MKLTNLLLAIISLFLVGCNPTPQKDIKLIKSSASSESDTLHINNAVLKASFQQEDTAYNEYYADRLIPIRENFKRINSINKWTSTDQKELYESAEGGEATFYYANGVLEKMVAKYYGETFQQLTEYYLLEGKLSFVLEKTYKYNRPLYYDSTAMKENEDNQAFDFEKSEIIEDRSYFDTEKLIHQVNNQDCGSPFANDYLLEEQNRLITDFRKLKAMTE